MKNKIKQSIDRWDLITTLLFIVFIAVRILPILQHAAPYTYDQGRDFLKAEEIVRYKNLTFIGPTTGIMGLFHGAWWYYILSIPYIIFNGIPTGFYVFMLLLTIISTVGFYLFLRKEFGIIPSLFWLSIVTFSPYFTSASYQASNNFLVPHFILLLLFAIYQFFKTRRPFFIFLSSLAAGFILESEVAFGMFMIPSFLLLLIIFSPLRKSVLTKKGIISLALGMIIPFGPRILFELKNHFLQTQTIINFFLKPKLHNPRDFTSIIYERTFLFWDYYRSIFIGSNTFIALCILIITIVALVYIFKNKKIEQIRLPLLYCFVLVFFLYLLSLVYKDNFWGNYYEGIQYIFLFIITLIFAAFYSVKFNRLVLISIVLLSAISAIVSGMYYLTQTKETEAVGLRRIEKTVDYIQSKEHSDKYCVKIYTPPVVPYTYNYLFSYHERVNKIPQPQSDFVDNKCWYIIEADPFAFRLEKWREDNIPAKAKLLHRKQITSDSAIEEWNL